jgi:hypothetical protein
MIAESRMVYTYIILIIFATLVMNAMAGITFDEKISLTGDGKMSGYTNSLMKEEFSADGPQVYNRVLSEKNTEGNIEVTYNSLYNLFKPSQGQVPLMKKYNFYSGKQYFSNRYKISTGSSFYSPSHEMSVSNLTSLWASNSVTSSISLNPSLIKVGDNVYEEFFGQVAMTAFQTNYNLAGSGILKERISDINIDNKRIDVAGIYINGSFNINSSAYSERSKSV